MIYPHFSERELMCPCCEKQGMDQHFMFLLECLRVAYKAPMILSSAYRCDRHDEAIGGKGPHRTGKAVDVLVSGSDAYRILNLAVLYGFTGIGIKQSGDWEKRFIHLDTLTNEQRPALWTYS